MTRALGAAICALLCLRCAHAPTPKQDSLQVQTFEYAWTRIRDTYPDPTFHGVDWNGVHQELLPRAQAARSASDLRPVLEAMFQRLGDSHFAVIPGKGDAAEALPIAPAAPSGRAPTAPPAPLASAPAPAPPPAVPAPPPATPGVHGEVGADVRLVGDQVLVSRLDPGSSAEAAGLRLGDALDRLDGTSVADLLTRIRANTPDHRELGLMVERRVLAWFSGTPGGSVAVVARGADDQPRAVTIPFRATDVPWTTLGSLPPMPVHVASRVLTPGPVGVVRFDVFVDPAPERFTEAIEGFLAASVHGIVVDLRGNPGGVAPMAMGMAGHFIAAHGQSLGTMQFRDMTLRLIVNPRAERFDGPVAVLVDGLSASSAEIFAAGLQKLGRARVFGEPSSGMALPSTWEALPDGDLMQFVTADFTDPSGARLERAGVIPDEVVPLTRDTLLAGHDAALDAAVAWINQPPGEKP